jgi:hypothetical protein
VHFHILPYWLTVDPFVCPLVSKCKVEDKVDRPVSKHFRAQKRSESTHIGPLLLKVKEHL